VFQRWGYEGAIATLDRALRWSGAASPRWPGYYALGLPFLSRRASSFIFVVEQDAARLAEHVAALVSRPKYTGAASTLRRLADN
jgi:hypothetical protein